MKIKFFKNINLKRFSFMYLSDNMIKQLLRVVTSFNFYKNNSKR